MATGSRIVDLIWRGAGHARTGKRVWIKHCGRSRLGMASSAMCMHVTGRHDHTDCTRLHCYMQMQGLKLIRGASWAEAMHFKMSQYCDSLAHDGKNCPKKRLKKICFNQSVIFKTNKQNLRRLGSVQVQQHATSHKLMTYLPSASGPRWRCGARPLPAEPSYSTLSFMKTMRLQELGQCLLRGCP